MAKKKSKSSSASRAPEPAPPLPIDQDDSELLDELLAHIDSNDTSQQTKAEAAHVIHEIEQSHSPSQTEDASIKKAGSSRAKFEARKLRKAAAKAADYPEEDKEATARLEKETRDEEQTIKKLCDDLKVQMFEINPDGHCLFSAVADQLGVLGLLSPAEANFRTTRLIASNYIFQHPDDFLPFLPSIDGEDGVGATDAGLISPAAFERYCVQVRDTAAWGGQPEILALSRAFNVPIHVIQHGQPNIVVTEPTRNGEASGSNRIARISYHRRMYGLGEHYNSLRPRTKPDLVEKIKDFLP